MLKALFFVEIFKLLSSLFVNVQKTVWLESKVGFKIYELTPGWQTMAIHILPNISQSKGNQTLKFGQVIEYNKRSFLL